MDDRYITWHLSRRVGIPVADAARALDTLVLQHALQYRWSNRRSFVARPPVTTAVAVGQARRLHGRLRPIAVGPSVAVELELTAWSSLDSALGLAPVTRRPPTWCARHYFTTAEAALETLGGALRAATGVTHDELTTVSRSLPQTRSLATVLFTDIVDSTSLVATVGDQRWRELLDVHDSVATTEIHRHDGRLVKHTGDGVLATFDAPGRTIQCARAIGVQLQRIGVTIRAGIHAGEIEHRGNDICGFAVHIAARLSSHARPGEITVSSTVRDLVAGSTISFEDRNIPQLNGAPDDLRVLAVVNS